MTRIEGLAAIADRYDAFVIDQFGVLHDGRTTYPGAVGALEMLRERGKRVVLVSNSGKRSAPNVERLARLGIGAHLFDAFVSSGEVAHAMISGGEVKVAQGARVLVVSRGDGAAALDGLGLMPTDDAAEADLVVIAGSEAERVPIEATIAALAPAAKRGVRALCTNPDLHMLANGGIHPGAGAIARRYEAAGGSVTWIGKPHAAIYEHAASALGGIDWSRTLGVGDSAEHDVAGVHGMGGDALLVETGVAGEGGDEGGPAADWVMSVLRA